MFDRSSETAGSRDAVSEVLLGMRLRGASYWRLRLSPPFGVNFRADGGARFHFIGQGEAVLILPDQAPRAMRAGDAVLIPRGHPHRILSGPRVAARDFDSYTPEPLCPAFCEIRACDATACRSKDTMILTGAMELDLATMHPLVALMPEAMSVDALLHRQPEMRAILSAMETEMAQDRPGSAGILARLADVIAALIVRGWVECGCDNVSTVITALRDPRLAQVLVALHKDPSRDWDIPAMARLMGSSRSVFAERFTATVGISPLRYVTDLRMRLAAQWLEREGSSVAEVAHRLGYGSQAAFARAFKRIVGVSPGNHRRRAS
ncbi:AraC family transcriptional regulator [Paenirhodobacter populi]|uniref:AraC family transcriptional regulator n=1 Tax=Paenirhodobacter populi TaxID=2306993 RepID=A0A443KNW3_9RHOB|nr:AraC family transcriptional regulator [Sinirhodobacter populi]RWR06898.1 AraC family transcriptional regulator [Sinirhodobacter populi]RWR15538.1 AraC family transcriptional regulator [Sinirhodobacter populi]RWR19028.1 AraC family transcriptional regulator [Sinirhodobacter populi]RWR28032.1 AraC family transcriptional regulator [Sinirhodobacter populi]RWR34459.1 AraC family transcriptional regulator [Sinirhodobacter populi]